MAVKWFQRQRILQGIDFQWSSTSIVHNVFRFYEMFFGRRIGIRRESTTCLYQGRITRTFHSWESICAHAETVIRDLFKGLAPAPVRITFPFLVTPQGFKIPTSPYLFAIAIDAFTSDAQNSGNTSFSHTCTGSNLIFFGGEEDEEATVQNTAMSYAGAALTAIVSRDGGSGSIDSARISGKLAPATGANTFAITTGSTAHCDFGASYSGVSQSALPSVTSGNSSATGISISTSATTTSDNNWVVGVFGNDNSNSITMATDTIQVYNSGGSSRAWFDSGNIPTASTSHTSTADGLTGLNWVIVVAVVEPAAVAAVAGGARNLSLTGVGQ